LNQAPPQFQQINDGSKNSPSKGQFNSQTLKQPSSPLSSSSSPQVHQTHDGNQNQKIQDKDGVQMSDEDSSQSSYPSSSLTNSLNQNLSEYDDEGRFDDQLSDNPQDESFEDQEQSMESSDSEQQEQERSDGESEREEEERMMVIDNLLEFGCFINAQDSVGDTPLHWAAREGHIGAVIRLLEAGADPFILNEDHESALHLAVSSTDNIDNENDKEMIIISLLEWYPNLINLQDLDGSTALHQSVLLDDFDIVEILLQFDPDLSVRDNSGLFLMTQSIVPSFLVSDICR